MKRLKRKLVIVSFAVLGFGLMNDATLTKGEEVEEQVESSDAIVAPKTVSSETIQEALPAASLYSADEVVIPDPVLKAVILSTLGKGAGDPVTEAEMLLLTDLIINVSSSAALSDLTGLEYAKNLTSFSMMGTSLITDFSALSQLNYLDSLRLQGTNVNNDNFPVLSNPSLLDLLSLSGSNVDTEIFTRLLSFTSLRHLSFDSNRNINTIEPLKYLPNLKTLIIQFCSVHDFTSITEFPSLTNLQAYGQTPGYNANHTTISSNELGYGATTMEFFIPLASMPNRLTNFDGYMPPLTTSTSASNTVLQLDGVQVAPSQLFIDASGITVSGISEDAFNQLTEISYQARIDSPAGSYVQPPGFSFYSISNGIYQHTFSVKKQGADVVVLYRDLEGNTLYPDQRLSGQIGDVYDVGTAQYQLQITGYELSSAHYPANTQGTFTNQEQTITFFYDRIEGAPVTVQYLDFEGNELAAAETLTGKMGTAYETSVKEFPQWQLTEMPANASGIFTDIVQTVSYVYNREPHTETTFPNAGSDNQQELLSNSLYQIPVQLSNREELIQSLINHPAFPQTVGDNPLNNNHHAETSSFAVGAGTVLIRYTDEKGNTLGLGDSLQGEIGEAYKIVAEVETAFP